MKYPLVYFALTLISAIAMNAQPVSPATAQAPGDTLAQLEVDSVWSGHPVGFAFLTERGHQFIAYYDAQRRITVASRRLDESTWTRFQPHGIHLPERNRASNVTSWDSHNYLTLALDRDGHLHLSGNLHNDPLIYYRSERPLDITSLQRLDHMTGQRENHTTYPVFFKNADGDLLFRYRDGGSGNGSDIYNRYDTATRTWHNIHSTPLIDGQGQRNAYALRPTLGTDGRFHLVWMWRDTPDAATNHTLSYARSADFLQWEKHDGTPIPLPITLANAEVIDPTPIGQGLINMTFNLGFDASHRPVVTYHRYDAAGKSQAYVARPSGGAANWEISPLSDWDFRWQFGGGGSLTAEVTLGPATLQPDHSLIVHYVTAHAPGSGRWRLDADTLRTIEQLPPIAPALPTALLAPLEGIPGAEVQTVVSRADGRRWILRWETLPRNRDRPRDSAPPPAALRVYEVPDADTGNATRVGS